MPRDGSGNYTLPAGNPVVTGTTITSAWGNTTMSDVAVQLNNVLTRDGLLGPLQPMKFPDGAIATPAMTFNSEPGLGWYRVGANIMALANANANAAVFDGSNGSQGVLRLNPRLTTGSPQQSLFLSNQPYGTANRTDAEIKLDQTELVISTIGVGAGSALPVRVTNATTFSSTASVVGTLAVGGLLSANAGATVTTSGSTSGLAVTDTGGNGANIRLTGNGGVNPSKTIRVQSGNLEYLNNAYSAVIATLTDAGTFTAVNVGIFSDIRRKENLARALGALSRVTKLQAYTYNLIGQEGIQRGLIAQEVQEVYPELVYENSEGFLAVNYLGLISELAQAIIELCVYTGINPDPV